MLQFRRPAMGQTDLGAVLSIIVAMELAFVLGPLVVLAILPAQMGALFEVGDTAFGVVLQLVSFGLYVVVLGGLVKRLHGRGLWSMIGPLGDTITAFKAAGWAVGLVILAQTVLPPAIDASEFSVMRPLLGWLAWMPVVLVALVIQTGAEEIYFRGYLQQQLACLSDKRWIWMGLPSLLFGVGHYMNGFGPADGVIYAIWATLLGLACADLTARTGNIGAAVGLHTANNLFAFVLTGVEGWPSNGLALFLYPYEDPMVYDYGLDTLLAPWAIFELLLAALMVLVMWLAARIAIKR